MPRGTRGIITTAHSAIAATATSAAIALGDFPSIYVEVDLGATGTPNWTITVLGAFTSTGTFVALTDVNNVVMSTGALTADGGETFRGCPAFIKILATENSGTGTATVKVQPVDI